MLGGADNPNGELPSYITGANRGERKYLSEAAEHHSGDFNRGTCSRSVIF
ncbi:hypothetical protein ECP03022936_5206 [Escherichia coli P0302293.6]|nr:hypothetical protein ECP03022936_5206 [Escherichia coli P0302293.6]